MVPKTLFWNQHPESKRTEGMWEALWGTQPLCCCQGIGAVLSRVLRVMGYLAGLTQLMHPYAQRYVERGTCAACNGDAGGCARAHAGFEDLGAEQMREDLLPASLRALGLDMGITCSHILRWSQRLSKRAGVMPGLAKGDVSGQHVVQFWGRVGCCHWLGARLPACNWLATPFVSAVGFPTQWTAVAA